MHVQMDEGNGAGHVRGLSGGKGFSLFPRTLPRPLSDSKPETEEVDAKAWSCGRSGKGPETDYLLVPRIKVPNMVPPLVSATKMISRISVKISNNIGVGLSRWIMIETSRCPRRNQ